MHYQEGRQYMTWDVNACVRGCVAGGATQIIVRDIHDTTANLVWHELDPHARYIMGSSRLGRMPGIETCDAVILLGYHAMAGTLMGILEHTSSARSWQNFWINGEKAGELAIEGARAGDHGVPVAMVSGDDKACAEAALLFEDAVLVEVKQGLDIEGGILLPMEEAHRKIQDGAAQAVRQCKNMRPYKVAAPVTLRLELVERSLMPSQGPHLRIIDGRTYEVTGDSMEHAIGRLMNV